MDFPHPRVTSTLQVTGDIEGHDLSALFAIPTGQDWRFFLRGNEPGCFRGDNDWRLLAPQPEETAWT